MKINYVTLKLWGSDNNQAASGILLLYQVEDGQLLQVGYRGQQVSEFPPLAWATWVESPIPGRFYNTMIPLPLSLTRGRTNMNSWLANNNGDLKQLIAGYNVAWTPAYQNPRIPPRAVANIDAAGQRYFADPGSAGGRVGGSYGGEGDRIAKIGAANFGATLDEVVDLGDPLGPAARRVLWAKMLKKSARN